MRGSGDNPGLDISHSVRVSLRPECGVSESRNTIFVSHTHVRICTSAAKGRETERLADCFG